MEKAKLYVYVTPTNRTFVEKIALKNNRSLSDFINELITAHRLKRPVKLEPKPTYLEEQAKKSKERRQRKLKELR